MTIDEFIGMLQETAPPARPEKLTELESVTGVSFPDDYRDFLTKCNGGYFEGKYFLEVGGFREEFGLSLSTQRDLYKDRIPEQLLWIMGDGCGNAFCLGLHGGAYGRLYFWEHEGEGGARWRGEIEGAANVTRVANSFSEFVANLTGPAKPQS